MKPYFTVDGVKFSTKKALVTYGSYVQDQAKNQTKAFLCTHDFLEQLAASKSEPEKYLSLKSRYDNLCQKSGIASPPELWVSRYNFAHVIAVLKTGQIVIDEATLDLLSKNETDALLAHELAHLMNGDKITTVVRPVDAERKADKVGAELVDNPMALASALNKLEKYLQELRKASKRFAIAEGTLRMIGNMSHAFLMDGQEHHPPTYQRVNALKKMAREKAPNQISSDRQR